MTIPEETAREIISSYSREELERSYINMWLQYVKLKQKYDALVTESSWERTARQQERSGSWI